MQIQKTRHKAGTSIHVASTRGAWKKPASDSTQYAAHKTNKSLSYQSFISATLRNPHKVTTDSVIDARNHTLVPSMPVAQPLARNSRKVLSLILSKYGGKQQLNTQRSHDTIANLFHKRIRSEYNNEPKNAPEKKHATGKSRIPIFYGNLISATSAAHMLSPSLLPLLRPPQSPSAPPKGGSGRNNAYKAVCTSIGTARDTSKAALSLSTGKQAAVSQIWLHRPAPSISTARTAAEKIVIGKHHPQLLPAKDPSQSTVAGLGESPTRRQERKKVIEHIVNSFRDTGAAPPTSLWFYKIGRTLGKGGFGKVCLGIHKLSGKLVAVKAISNKVMSNEASRSKLMREVSIWGQLMHPNIIRLYETFESDKHFLYIEELCAGGDLLTYVRKRRRLKEAVARHVLRQILEALQHCHQRSILHRDIKLDNILLNNEGTVKVCDFGVSKVIRPGELIMDQCGTPAYIAPEMLAGAGYEGFAGDIWSAGIVLYAMIYGTVPFKAKTVAELSRLITKGTYELKEDASAEARDLIQKMLEKDPRRRASIEQIFSHAWFADYAPTAGIARANPCIVQLFTAEERTRIAEEFNYSGVSAAKGEAELDMEDEFVEQSIESSQADLTKNATTKSVIFAPFNTTLGDGDDNSVTERLEERDKVLRLGPKVREADAQYERNNNCDIDNGVYNAEEKETKVAKSETATDARKSSEHEVPLEMQTVKKVAECGYPVEYVVGCLENSQRNHASTTYYLMFGNVQGQ